MTVDVAPRFPSLEAAGFELSSGALGPTCRGCGCSDRRACPGGCAWVEDPEGLGDFCSRCLIDTWNGVNLPLELEGMADAAVQRAQP